MMHDVLKDRHEYATFNDIKNECIQSIRMYDHVIAEIAEEKISEFI